MALRLSGSDLPEWVQVVFAAYFMISGSVKLSLVRVLTARIT